MITTILTFLKGNILKLVMENASKIGWMILAFLLYMGIQEYIDTKISIEIERQRFKTTMEDITKSLPLVEAKAREDERTKLEAKYLEDKKLTIKQYEKELKGMYEKVSNSATFGSVEF